MIKDSSYFSEGIGEPNDSKLDFLDVECLSRWSKSWAIALDSQ